MTEFTEEYLRDNFIRLNDVKMGENVRIFSFVNAYGCEIGDETRVGAFVEIQKGVKIGKRCKISSHSFLCEGVTLEDGVFIGHGVMFTNDKIPSAVNEDGSLKTATDWTCLPTLVKAGAAIGSNAVILPGLASTPNRGSPRRYRCHRYQAARRRQKRQTTRSTVAILAWITSHTGVNDAFWNARRDAWLSAEISAHDR